MAKREYVGKETFPTIWNWICVVFNVIGILAVIMLIIAEIIIIANNFNNYVDQYGHSYRASPYAGPDSVTDYSCEELCRRGRMWVCRMDQRAKSE